MTFDGWGFDAGWHLSQPTGFVGYILLLVYSLVAIGILMVNWPSRKAA